MVVGIGTDLVFIPRIRETINIYGDSFIKKTFTTSENEGAFDRKDKAKYYATLFACKEAVFKAISHSLNGRSFDLRTVETLHNENGEPYISISDDFRTLLKEIGINSLLVTVSHEKDYVVAFVIAQ